MRIENLLLNNINTNYSQNIFKEGSIFKGEVLEVLEELILIDIGDQGIIKATSDMDIKSLVGNQVSFLVKSNKDGQMELKPLIREEILPGNLQDKSNNSISKILNSFNIKETNTSIDLVKNLMKYNAQINETNITQGIKGLEKLIELTSLEEDGKVVLFSSKSLDNKQIIENNEVIKEESSETDNSVERKVSMEGNIREDTEQPQKVDIKNLLVVDKNSYPEKEDISSLVKEFLGTEIKIEGEEFNKILSFFIKNDIEPSLNNIKNLRELVREPIEFSKEFAKLTILLDEFKDKGNFQKVKEFVNGIQLKKENIEENSNNIKELQKIIGESENKTILGSNFKREINDLENKIDFLREMNQDLSFLILPLNYGKEELDGVLTLFKEEKTKKTREDNINIFINLDTNNLGNIKITCQAKLESLSIRMNIQKEDLKIFQLAEQGLIDKIGSMGYIVDRINFVVDKDISIMDTMATNPSPTYFLDIKV